MPRYDDPQAGRHEVGRTDASVRQADWRSTVARFGLSARGVLYAALGILAIQFAAGDASSAAATRGGAIELVASQPLGQWLLGVLTAGLFALAVWQAILTVRGDPVEGSEATDRAKYAARTVIYLATASTALGILVAHLGADPGSAGAGGGASGQEQAAATVMDWPGGAWLVGLCGAALIAAAGQQAYAHAARKGFMQRLDRARMHPTVETAVERSGQAGYAARAVVLLVVGIFLVVAAIQHDADRAVGLSGALKTLAEQGWGQLVLWLVAIGLFLYGVFCFGEARYRRAT